MKKIIFSILILSTLLFSCSMSPDQMVQKFNGTIYQDLGNGIYLTDGKPNIHTGLIKNDVYSVNVSGYRKIEVSEMYFTYKWTLKDTVTGNEMDIGNYHIVYIYGPSMKLIPGRDYELSLLVKNGNGLLFMDKATIKVVK